MEGSTTVNPSPHHSPHSPFLRQVIANNQLTFKKATYTTGNHIAALDISDLNNVKRLDDPNEVQPTIAPHYIKVTPDQKRMVATDYFLQTGDIGLINTPADFKALYIDNN